MVWTSKKFRLQMNTEEFENRFWKVMTSVHPDIASGMRRYLQQWIDHLLKNDIHYRQLRIFYHKLWSQGYYNVCYNYKKPIAFPPRMVFQPSAPPSTSEPNLNQFAASAPSIQESKSICCGSATNNFSTNFVFRDNKVIF